jgi:hypothetical protein
MPKQQPTGWVGWVYFASAMMLLAGGMQAIAGLVALFKDDYYVVGESGVLAFNYSTWGWVHLLVGLVIFAAGLATAAGRTWGRAIGVIMAVTAALANVAFLSAYPVWSVIAIVVDIFVIYALTIHGSEARVD